MRHALTLNMPLLRTIFSKISTHTPLISPRKWTSQNRMDIASRRVYNAPARDVIRRFPPVLPCCEWGPVLCCIPFKFNSLCRELGVSGACLHGVC